MRDSGGQLVLHFDRLDGDRVSRRAHRHILRRSSCTTGTLAARAAFIARAPAAFPPTPRRSIARPALPAARDGTFVFPASPGRFPSFATRETAPGDDFAAEPLLAPRAPLLFSYCSASVGALCRAAAAAARVSSAAFAAAARTAATVFPGLARSAASAAARLAAAAARPSVPGGDRRDFIFDSAGVGSVEGASIAETTAAARPARAAMFASNAYLA